MIEALKDDKIIDQIGGRFKLTALIQRRVVQLMHGARPMVPDEGLTIIELAVREVLEGKVKPKAPTEESDVDADI
jgi:DNA-directed RNA polymerase subunit omega